MGNLSERGLNGHDRFGDEAVPFGEILPDLSRKIYFVYRHPISKHIGWRSILVSTVCFEGGPKNPLKGTSMKFLVPACYAQ
jgi:hypothetical protein